MADEPTKWLTCGQAAALCSVKPDTVQKWIRNGRLSAQRTAGGHYRIARQEIEPFLTGPVEPRWFGPPPANCHPQPLRCWEYFEDNHAVRDACKKCVVYRVRAAWCFEVLGLGPDIAHSRVFCSAQNSCEDCVYYQRVRGVVRVLVISADEKLVSGLRRKSDGGYTFAFTDNAFHASTLIGSLRPGFVVVDQDLCDSREPRLLDCLMQESRVPGLRVIICGRLGQGVPPLLGGNFVSTWIEKPFDRAAIERIVDSFPVEHFPSGEADCESCPIR